MTSVSSELSRSEDGAAGRALLVIGHGDSARGDRIFALDRSSRLARIGALTHSDGLAGLGLGWSLSLGLG